MVAMATNLSLPDMEGAADEWEGVGMGGGLLWQCSLVVASHWVAWEKCFKMRVTRFGEFAWLGDKQFKPFHWREGGGRFFWDAGSLLC